MHPFIPLPDRAPIPVAATSTPPAAMRSAAAVHSWPVDPWCLPRSCRTRPDRFDMGLWQLSRGKCCCMRGIVDRKHPLLHGNHPVELPSRGFAELRRSPRTAATPRFRLLPCCRSEVALVARQACSATRQPARQNRQIQLSPAAVLVVIEQVPQCPSGLRMGDQQTLCAEIAAGPTDVATRQRGPSAERLADEDRPRSAQAHESLRENLGQTEHQTQSRRTGRTFPRPEPPESSADSGRIFQTCALHRVACNTTRVKRLNGHARQRSEFFRLSRADRVGPCGSEGWHMPSKPVTKGRRSALERDHTALLREAISRPGVREAVEVYLGWQEKDRHLDAYRSVTSGPNRVITTDSTKVD